MTPHTKRNKQIRELLKSKRLSYQVIADMLSTTRNVVAGVAFRHRHPPNTRVSSPCALTHGFNSQNKMGHGWQAQSYSPRSGF